MDADYPPPGITQMEWAEMSTSERAAATYAGDPSSFEGDLDVDRFRWATRWAGR